MYASTPLGLSFEHTVDAEEERVTVVRSGWHFVGHYSSNRTQRFGAIRSNNYLRGEPRRHELDELVSHLLV